MHVSLTILLSITLVNSGVDAFAASRSPFLSVPTSLYSSSNSIISIALTREEGKNDKLRTELEARVGIQTILHELPCIAHAEGSDYNTLSSVLSEQPWDYVAVTSPEAAKVLSTAWKGGADVVAVGKATQAALEEFGIPVAFCPSKATAETLVRELAAKQGVTTVLYPASAKAAMTLQDGLEARGFSVTRLNTYDTVTATWSTEEQAMASTTQIVCFGSPSAVEGWLANTNNKKDILAACIGETSAEACRKFNFSEGQIFFPDKPGIPGWTTAVLEAMESLKVAHS
jgi:uroporphyrinogen-III synthase